MAKTALITGITGQDGSFLAEFLLEKGYDVHGIIRRSSSFNTGRIEQLYLDEWVRDMKNKRILTLHYGDLTDSSSLVRIVQTVQPDEIYNLGAQSHVLPALIRRFHEAKINGLKEVTCWGDGSPLREFLYVDDLANLCVFLMNNYSGNETVNAGTGKELTIKALTELVAKVVGYAGEIRWDTTRPNGTPRKLLDVSKAAKLGWTYKTELEDGIRLAYEDFLNNPMRAV